MNIPSKELLSAALGNSRIISDGCIEERSNTLQYSCYCGYPPDDYWEEVEDINIYELMHLMKEWAFAKGYYISLYRKRDGLEIEVGKINESYYEYKSLLFDLPEEVEQVTKACEWILEQQK